MAKIISMNTVGGRWLIHIDDLPNSGLGTKAPLCSEAFVKDVGVDTDIYSFKLPVRVASMGNIAIASALVNGSVIDGITLATGDRVLLNDQTDPAENGIYVVVAAGAASRSLDMNSLSPDEISNSVIPVSEGSQAGSHFVQFGVVTTLGVDAINFNINNSIGASSLWLKTGLGDTEWTPIVSSNVWGTISGDILDQKDLQAALALKANVGGGGITALKATAVIDYANIGNDLELDFAIVVTGAVTGDGVVLGRPSTQNLGLITEGIVSANGVVVVRAHNVHSVAIDQSGMTYNVIVIPYA